MHLVFSPLGTNSVALSLGVPFDKKIIFNSELDSYRTLTLINLPSEFLTHWNMFFYSKNRADIRQPRISPT